MKVIAINKYQLNRLFYLNNFTFVLILFDSIRFYKNNKLHNKNGPAIICNDEYKVWCINGLYHREDGPAVEYANGVKQWRYKDEFYGENNYFTIESWKEKVEELKHEEELEIFK